MNNVYLCVKEDLVNFKCQKFNDFIEADKFFMENYKDVIIASTMISVFKYFPKFIQNFIVNYELKNLFIKNKMI